MKVDFAIYAVHVLFWTAFGVAAWIITTLGRKPDVPAPAAREEQSAPMSRSLLTFHMIAFGVMYFGIGNAVFPHRVPAWFPGQRIVGTIVIMSGSALMASARAVFRSWRFRAKLDFGHQLATDGPFRYLRHPIYMGLNLLALGSAIWIPTPTLWIAAAWMIVGSDLRARAEEKLLTSAFGNAYVEYSVRTRRFIPGIY